MKEIIILKNLYSRPDRKMVFKTIQCYEDSVLYDEICDEYDKVREHMQEHLDLKGVMGMREITKEIASEDLPEGTKIIYVINTIGKYDSELSNTYFQQGDYLKGMLADAIADSFVFGMEKSWQMELRNYCREKGIGIKRRLEVPKHVPMLVQKIAFDELNAGEHLGMTISSGYMYSPQKSLCSIFVVDDDPDMLNTYHDCQKCGNLNCSMRRIIVSRLTVYDKNKSFQAACLEGESILDALQKVNPNYTAVCGGKGICGKCDIRVLAGKLDITTADKNFFSKEDLEAGYRLACQAYPEEDLTISLEWNSEDRINVVTSFSKDNRTLAAEGDEYGIAIDIGTTTLAMGLISIKNGAIVDTYSDLNHQRIFGADVLSRIDASNDGKKDLLQQIIRKDLLAGICKLVNKNLIKKDKIKEVVISGNTTMGHLLMGYSCKTLGVAPFTPINIATINEDFSKIFNSDFLNCKVIVMPGISTFVGGDIVSGIINTRMTESEDISILIDLGTNGEMVIGNRSKLLVTSAAAGPAFEGGNIQHGMGSIPGAICHVDIRADRTVEYETIENEPPIGICGTGVIETAAGLVRNNIVDKTGLLESGYFEKGFELAKDSKGNAIVFTQKDVREIQLAKSAIRAGIEILITRFGIKYEDVKRVYIAGGFGYRLNPQMAMIIGILPKEFEGKITAVGNSSLGGAVDYVVDPSVKEKAEYIRSIAEEISLGSDPIFQDQYMEHMAFHMDED